MEQLLVPDKLACLKKWKTLIKIKVVGVEMICFILMLFLPMANEGYLL